MFCYNCGKPLVAGEAVCSSCGAATGAAKRFCPGCGAETDAAAAFCVRCGIAMTAAAPPASGAVARPLRSRLVAGVLGVLLGGLGIHRFYLGYTAIGVIQLCLTLGLGIVTCGIGALGGHIWGLVEGVLILTGSIDRDAEGRPLGE